LPGTPPPIPGDSAAARRAIERIAERIGAGDMEGARALASAQVEGPRSGQAHWQLGIIAYRQHDYAEAVRQFELSTRWPHHGGWAMAAAHYWAARSRLAAGETAGVTLHFEAAAQRPWTFYGQLAEAQLGRDSPLSFAAPDVEADTLARFVERYPGARRAAALAQLGRLSEVESELRRLHADLSADEDRVFLALAIALEAPAAQLRAAEYGGRDVAAGFCPTTSFEPDDGFSLDRAVIYAIVRQESYFNPKAVSVSNARGLMQLLPSTARDMDRSTNYRRNPSALFEPGLNMRLGQSYVRWLMDQFHNDGDLGRVFAAYNGGPGWLSRWLATQPADIDPLLLLEMLPRAESRDYAERALSHMSLCRKRYGQPTPELDRLASGAPAIYTPLDARMAER
jgi:soluble lytic murein transglycosylase-like protein